MIAQVRLDAANAALAFFAPETRLEASPRGIRIAWTDYKGKVMSRRWQVRSGQDFYPTWSEKWSHGGTCCLALSQLVRWCQERPVLPLPSWRYWCSEKVWLAESRGTELLAVLEAAGYPPIAACVLCHNPITAGLDWWHLDSVSGPCCGWTSGCRE